jgi:hypothetical protein
MAVSVDQSSLVPQPQDRSKRFANRYGLIIFVFSAITVTIYAMIVGPFAELFLFTVFLLAPMAPCVMLEHRWEGEVLKGNQSTASMYYIIKNHRLPFILAGLVTSFLIIPVGLILRIILDTNELNDNSFDWNQRTPPLEKISFPILFIVVLCSILVGIVSAASIYRVRSEKYDTGHRFNLISSPSQAITFASYHYIGVHIGIWMLWAGLRNNRSLDRSFSSSLDDTEMYQSVPLDFISFWTMIPIFIILSVFYISFVFSAQLIPQLISGSLYQTPTSKQFTTLGKPLVIYSFIFIIMAYVAMDYSGTGVSSSIKQFIHYTFIFLPPLIIYLSASSTQFSGTRCQTCNLVEIDGNCFSCGQVRGLKIPFKLSISRKLKHPTCPSCGQIWLNLSRKCPNCSFTVILSCEKCSQTLNPLWHACNICGEPRKTIPELALDVPGSPGFARSQAFLLVLLAFLIPALVLQTSIVINILNKIDRDPIEYRQEKDFLYDDLARILYLLILIIAILSLVVIAFNDEKRPMMLVANKIAIFPSTILVFTLMFLFVFTSFFNLFSFGNLLGNIFLFLISCISLVFSLLGYYRSLIQFRPIVVFDPILIMNTGDEVHE